MHTPRHITLFCLLTLLIVLTFPSNAKTHKLFLTSIMKCGTHLALKCVTLITSKSKAYVEEDEFVTLQQKTIDKLTKNQILVGHIQSNKHNQHILAKNNFKGVFIYRDPRDFVVSLAHWIPDNPAIWPNLQKLSFDELLLELIKTIPISYAPFLAWRNNPMIYTTTFERLVGPKGNGNQTAQLIEVQNIARHIGSPLNLTQIQDIAYNLFGGTYTFREGKTGSWKNYFNRKHKAACKLYAGKLLIDLGYENNTLW
jgi:sulfotransferase 6B1